MSDRLSSENNGSMPQVFVTTQWSVVMAAGANDKGAKAMVALETLCRSYWLPLFAFVRKKGYNATDAEDLVQGFFARLLKRNDIGSIQREKGRFRSGRGYENCAA